MTTQTQKSEEPPAAHTPGPYEYLTEHGNPPRCLLRKGFTGKGAAGRPIAIGEIYSEEDAASIVRYMNVHNMLVEALRRAIQHVPANAVSMADAVNKPVKECRTLDFCTAALRLAQE